MYRLKGVDHFLLLEEKEERRGSMGRIVRRMRKLFWIIYLVVDDDYGFNSERIQSGSCFFVVLVPSFSCGCKFENEKWKRLMEKGYLLWVIGFYF